MATAEPRLLGRESPIEVVRGAYEAFAAGGTAAILEVADEEIELALFPPIPAESYHGRSGLLEFSGEWDGAWSEYAIEPQAFVSNGDRVLVLARFRGRGRAGGVPVDAPVAQVWTLRSGRLTRGELYADAAEAMRACGLDPETRIG